jgi:succinate-semialdehyde dehydrogenase/glutarate-semialdehyde dehydrogenase
MVNPESVQTVGERHIVTYPLMIGGKEVPGDSTTTVYDKFTGQPIAHFASAGRSHVADAVQAAADAFKTHPLAPYQRYTILLRTAELVQAHAAELIESIVAESGFTVSDARTELNRSVQTLILSAEEAKRIRGEMVPLESAPDVRNRIGFTIRLPLGVVCAITPFNSPLNTVTHKVAPALAAGNSVVLKPASATPITAALLCRLLIEAGLPHGYINLLNGNGRDIGRWLLEEEQIRFYTFTGSTEVGRAIQRGAGLRRTQLELGSIASTIVCEDASLEWAVPRCVNASFRKAGQVCTSVQRLLVHADVLDRFLGSMVAHTERAKVGDPRDPATLVGPMIDVREAERAEAWVKEAVAQGATIATGGRRDGAVLQPTVLLNVTPKMRVMCDEVFAPIISILPFHSLDEAFRTVNDSPYGLAAGLFTSNINTAMTAARQLEVGTVHVNETSSSRVDLMPYGGVKDSGFGHEGPKYAIREMTEERLVTIASVP